MTILSSPTPADTPFVPASLTEAALASRFGKRARHAITAYLIGKSLWATAQKAKVRYESRSEYTLSVSSHDGIYPVLHAWVIERMPPSDRRAITVSSGRGNDHELLAAPDSYGGSKKKRKNDLHLALEPGHELFVEIETHWVNVQVVQPEQQRVNSSNDFYRPIAPEKIIFKTKSEEGRDAVVRLLLELANQGGEELPRLNIANPWGDWNRGTLSPRRIDTVALPAGQKADILADFKWFLGAEELHTDLGLPWHRGYLFYGPPGTGKTSFARALACHYGLDVYFIPLSSVEEDFGLLRTISNIPARSLLLLEDIDVLHGAKFRDDNHPGVSMSALLNALDGVITPNGLITIMTTNDRSELDDALMRPGRADRIFEFDYLTVDGLAELGALLVGHSVELPFVGGQTAASLIEAAKPSLGDPVAVEAALRHALTFVSTEGSHGSGTTTQADGVTGGSYAGHAVGACEANASP